jgi:hypothetical protein
MDDHDHALTATLTIDAALDLVVGRTGVARYRHLASAANTLPAPNSADDWRRWILAEAARDPSQPAVAAAVAVAVDYGDPAPRPCGGCPGHALAAGTGAG